MFVGAPRLQLVVEDVVSVSMLRRPFRKGTHRSLLMTRLDLLELSLSPSRYCQDHVMQSGPIRPQTPTASLVH